MTRSPNALVSMIVAAAASTGALAAASSPSLPDGFYRFPSISSGAIVFASEGDLWRVPVEGGVATRLTSHEGEERFPKLSPDGAWIAFTAQYEGNDDVYVMPATGGEPKRLTFHPREDQTLGWTQDGKILFRSRRDHPHADYRIFTIEPSGGIPTMVPLEPAAWISYEPGGRRIAVQKIGLEFHNWKRYKGGEAEEIYVGTLSPLEFTEIAKYDGKDAFPMWAADGRIYFVTDRWGRPNLASMKPDGSDVTRLTSFDDYDVRWPSMGAGKIVFQHKMDLWTYDLATRKSAIVPIQLPGDRVQVRERVVDPMANLGAWGLSKDGERIALEARGDVFVTRTHKKGLIRRITESSSVRTKTPAFSPDGKWLAVWTEVDGEEQLVLESADNSAPSRQLGSVGPGFHFAPVWSPDGTKIAWGDNTWHILTADARTGERTTVEGTSNGEITQYEWSPDSRYLAYTIGLDNEFSQVKIWDSKDRTNVTVTDPMFSSFSPTWDPKGKFLFYLSDRYVNPYLDRWENRFIVDNATLPYVVALQADGTLPFAPRGDQDPKPKEEKKDDASDKARKAKGKDKDPGAGVGKKEDDGDEGADKDKPVEPVRIDVAGLADRIVQVPVDPGNYAGLKAIEGKLHWLRIQNRGMMPAGEESDDEEGPGGDLVTFDIDKEKLSTLASGVTGYDVSMNGKVLVYKTKQGFTRVEAGATSAPKDDDAEEAKVDLGGWTMEIDPREEWKQMLHEAWRLERDYFYDAKMHGVDWPGVWMSYGPLADRISTRDDLEDLLGEVLGELSVGHAYHWGGDYRRGKRVSTGLLAADLQYDPATGFWRIQKIYMGDYPAPDTSSPLARPDLHVAPGTWLVAIDGHPLVKGEDYLARLAGRAGQEVELSVNSDPKLEGARRIVVKPVGDDTAIRYASWIRENRAYVDQKSHGQIGYLHLYDMGGLGLRQFARDFAPQWNKRGLIIDDRWNHGGFVAPMILAHLDRKLLSIGNARQGGMYTTPDRAFHGHIDTLINRQGGSDCETLAMGMKDFKMGTVIGTRTWGGWIGIRGDKHLRDGGTTTQPEFGGWDPQGKVWQIEGHGVDPDVVLDLGPNGLMGKDVQLDYAIQDLTEKIAKDPMNYAPPPPIVPRPLVSTR